MNNYTVVVVDDHTLLSQAIEAMVNTFEQFKVLYTCKNGKELTEHFADSPSKVPNIVLMDINMPVMDGVEATSKILALQGDGTNEHCAIVGLSAHATRGDRSKYLRMGMVEYLTKPIVIEELERILKECLVPSQD